MRNEGVPPITVYLYSMGQEFPNHWVAIHLTTDHCSRTNILTTYTKHLQYQETDAQCVTFHYVDFINFETSFVVNKFPWVP